MESDILFFKQRRLLLKRMEEKSKNCNTYLNEWFKINWIKKTKIRKYLKNIYKMQYNNSISKVYDLVQ